MKAKTVHLGYEVGTGAAVEVPLFHLAVTGQTQHSGKTTTLEALVARSGVTALTFVTKRGEGSFASGRRIAPYFRDRADWQFVTSILDATLQEKNKFLRPTIMRICRNTKTLKDVHEAVRGALTGTKKMRGWDSDIYTQLDEYLNLIVPEIARAKLSTTLDLQPGLNVMDVTNFAMPMQMLFIQSAIDWVNETCDHTVVVIPEAWEFIPEGKGSPVKASATVLVRKGGGIGNFIWVDSQDMAGVDKVILRGCTVWLIGVQREANEIKRALSNIPASIKRPTAAQLATLDRGQFYACFGQHVIKTYVQPAWMSEAVAMSIATGQASIETASPPPTPIPVAAPIQEDEVNEAEARALREENEHLKADVEAAETRGYECGMTAALRQAGEYWNAAALDLRDNSKRVMDMAENLAAVAREGRWSVPRGAAAPQSPPRVSSAATTGSPRPAPTPVAPPGLALAQPSAEASGGGTPRKPGEPGAITAGARALLDVLVRSHPQPLSAALWAAFANKTARGGWWNGVVRQLRDAGYVETVGGQYAATLFGIEVSNEKPARPKNSTALWGLWCQQIAEAIGNAGMSLLVVLAAHRDYKLTTEQWALLAGKAASGGYWNGAVKALRDWDCVVSDGLWCATESGLALFDPLPAKADTGKQLREARIAAMEPAARRLYDALSQEGATPAQLAQRTNLSTSGGYWNGALKGLRDSWLVADDDGTLRPAAEPLERAA